MPIGVSPWNKGLTKETDARVAEIARKISESLSKVEWSQERRLAQAERMRKIGKARKGRISEAQIQNGLKNLSKTWSAPRTEKQLKAIFENLSVAWELGRHISYPQRQLFSIIKQDFPDAEVEYRIKTKNGYRWVDVALPSLKVAFEYDGELHEDREEYDKQRDLELSEVGWVTFRFDKNKMKKIKEETISMER